MQESEKAALRAVFGTEQVLDVRRLPGKGPLTEYRLRIPGHHLEQEESRTEWQEVQARFSVDASGKRYSASGAWPGLKASGAGAVFNLDTVRFTMQQMRDASGIWLGKTHGEADRIALRSTDAPLNIQFEHATFDGNSKRQGKTIDSLVESAARRLQVGETVIDQPHFALKARGMDSATLLAFRDAANQLRSADLPPAEAAAQTIKQTTELFRALALKGASIELSDLSGVYQGARYQVKGRVAMPGLTAADLLSTEKTLASIEAQLDITLPLPVLHGIARGITRVTNDKAGQDNLREQDAYDFMLGKLLGSGFARMEKDKLVAHLDIRGGVLRITDSKEQIPLKSLLDALNQQNKPAKPGTPEAPPADHSAPVSVTWRERRLESVLLFAGNGEVRAIDELCYRYTKGDHAPQDAAEAEKWCARSKNPPDLSDGQRNRDDPAVYQLSVEPAYFSASYVRFDESKSRDLELTLSQPGKDEVYWPMISVCLMAEAPSQMACVKISPQERDTLRPLRAEVALRSTDNKSEKTAGVVSGIETENGQFKLRVFVRDQKAHFVFNDRDALEQPIVFPVELIQLGCSTADCRFKFN